MRAGPGFPYLLIVLLDNCPNCDVKKVHRLRGGQKSHCVPADPIMFPICPHCSLRSLTSYCHGSFISSDPANAGYSYCMSITIINSLFITGLTADF